MKLSCDLHIHTALSPCGDMDMTPNNIVNMALLKGLNLIAITDHNAIANAEAVIKCAENTPLTVLAGMELETSEEVHFVCLFPCFDAAKLFYQEISRFFPPIQNRPELFGEQAVMNEKDEIVGYEPRLLLSAASCSVYTAAPLVRQFGGVIYPAHVDRDSYSVISNLGFVPPDLDFHTVELSRNITSENAVATFPHLAQYQTLTASDAHYLWDIYEQECPLNLSEASAEALLSYLKGRTNID